MLLIMDHNPCFFEWEGNAVSKLRGLLAGFSPGCRLVNTRPPNRLENVEASKSVFVWVYYYGIFLFCK